MARIDVVHDTYFGETLSDPYRWMENSKDPEWLPFLKGQNEHTRAVLDALPTRAALLQRIQHANGQSPCCGTAFLRWRNTIRYHDQSAHWCST